MTWAPLEPETAAPPPRAPAPTTKWLAPLALATAVVLVAGLLALAFVHPSAGGIRATTVEVSPDAPAPRLPGAEGALTAALPPIMRFVAKARGLPFVRPVRVTLLSDHDFRRQLDREEQRDAAKRREQLKTTEHVLQALGLLDRGVDLEKAVNNLLGSSVAGFYQPRTKRLYVRGEALTPETRVTLAHELTHALQDQHFKIDRPDLEKKNDESSDGLTGLVEGDAVRIERMYLASLPAAEQKQAQAEEAQQASGIDPNTPPVLEDLVIFPYVAGPDFTTALVAKAGQPGLDDAFSDPPTTSEQLLHPDKFLAGEGARPVARPAAGGKIIDDGVLGEFGVDLLLSRTMAMKDAMADGAGWGGDRYVAWRTGDQTCVRVAILMDTDAAAQKLSEGLAALARRDHRVRLAGTQPETVTSCG